MTKFKGLKNSLTNQLGTRFDSFRSDTKTHEELTKELQDRTERIKVLIDHYDKICLQLGKVEQQYEAKSKSLFDMEKLTHIKAAITKIKKEVFGMNVQMGVYRGHLSREQLKEGGNAFEMYNNISKHSHQDNYEDDSFEI